MNAKLPIVVTELPIVNFTRFLHSYNADSPIVVTELGMMIYEIELQRTNAQGGIVFTLFPIFTVFKLMQP